jgi:AhpD family alkylhydroperoxidase
MPARIEYRKINPDAYQAMAAVSASARSIDPILKAIVDVRVSQINGCAFCLDMHLREARDLGVSEQRLDCLAGWRELDSFTDRERAALEWAEALTDIARTHAPGHLFDRLKAVFSESEIVGLTVAICAINSWNRMLIAMHVQPPQC